MITVRSKPTQTFSPRIQESLIFFVIPVEAPPIQGLSGKHSDESLESFSMNRGNQ